MTEIEETAMDFARLLGKLPANKIARFLIAEERDFSKDKARFAARMAHRFMAGRSEEAIAVAFLDGAPELEMLKKAYLGPLYEDLKDKRI